MQPEEDNTYINFGSLIIIELPGNESYLQSNGFI